MHATPTAASPVALLSLKLHNQPLAKQTGDVLNADGTGSFSAWDGTFADETLAAFTHERGGFCTQHHKPTNI